MADDASKEVRDVLYSLWATVFLAASFIVTLAHIFGCIGILMGDFSNEPEGYSIPQALKPFFYTLIWGFISLSFFLYLFYCAWKKKRVQMILASIVMVVSILIEIRIGI